eukprot:914959_1
MNWASIVSNSEQSVNSKLNSQISQPVSREAPHYMGSDTASRTSSPSFSALSASSTPTRGSARKLHQPSPVRGRQQKMSPNRILPASAQQANSLPLKDLKIFDSSHLSKPRGFVNKNNTCFMNSILQSLFGCREFIDFLESDTLSASSSAESTLTAMKSLWRLFSPSTSTSSTNSVASSLDGQIASSGKRRRRRRKKNASRKSSNDSIDSVKSVGRIVSSGSLDPLDPKSLDQVLQSFSDPEIHGPAKQHDAQEFLNYLLSRLHSETARCPEEKGQDNEFDEWQEVGKKNKSQVICAEVELEKSPVNAIFAGRMRNVLRSRGRPDSVSYQPFFTLPLDVPSHGDLSVMNALRTFLGKEDVHGYRGADHYEVKASKSTTFDIVPPILVLHVKRFVYDSRGLSKMQTHVKFGMDLSIPQHYIFGAKSSRSQYRLFAVVSHHGPSPVGGHYTACIRHGEANWAHCNDAMVSYVSKSFVLSQCAYLLFYRRVES